MWRVAQRGGPNALWITAMALSVFLIAPVLANGSVAAASGGRLAKRTIDVVLTLMGLVAIWPLFVVIALAIRVDSAGPAFFVQTRVGRDGRTFGMVKFRSMVVNAEMQRADVPGDRDGLCFKAKDDPRITRVGRFLRRASLDELPQLWNVLRGQMSLVGPRPALPSEVAAYPTAALERLRALPGITGMWQVSGRADISFDDMIALDVAYVRHPSLRRDIAILAATFRVVLQGRGAY
jgi:lipopolysaccharide/colanic/teichoic acid biosynthesis glycosyltransferase